MPDTDQRSNLLGLARSSGLVADTDSDSAPASHEMYLMQIETTLGLLGRALSMVHSVVIDLPAVEQRGLDAYRIEGLA